jgi:hypothetical protein
VHRPLNAACNAAFTTAVAGLISSYKPAASAGPERLRANRCACFQLEVGLGMGRQNKSWPQLKFTTQWRSIRGHLVRFGWMVFLKSDGVLLKNTLGGIWQSQDYFAK